MKVSELEAARAVAQQLKTYEQAKEITLKGNLKLVASGGFVPQLPIPLSREEAIMVLDWLISVKKCELDEMGIEAA